VGFPGRYPFTRGPYPTMYRGRGWTMRQLAGYGTGEDTNRRFRYLIENGQKALSVVFDMPTLMGYDSDHPLAAGEVGREGAAVDTLDDMAALFAGIDLTRTSVSMTINPTAFILLAMYVAVAQDRGYDLDSLSGTTQADILKEYMAEKEWIYPIRPSLRIVRDMIVYSRATWPGTTRSASAATTSTKRERARCKSSPSRSATPSRTSTRSPPRGCRSTSSRRGSRSSSRRSRTFRGGGEVPRRPSRLGEDRQGAVRRAEAGIDAPALPLPDCGRLADPGRADEQHRPHRSPSFVRRARGAQSVHANGLDEGTQSHRRSDEDRAADAADHRRGDAGGERRRSAGRIVLRGVAHQRARTRDLRHPGPGSRRWAAR